MRFNIQLCCAAASATLLLSACVDNHNSTQTINNVSVGAQPRIVQAAPPPQSLPPLKLMAKTVVSGKEDTVFNEINLRPDCSIVGQSWIGVVSPPNHGMIEVVHEDGKVAAPPGNPYYACSNRPLPATKLKYVSNPGYSGADSIRIMVRSPDGKYSQFQVALTVQPG